jgi:hypothetical protein
MNHHSKQYEFNMVLVQRLLFNKYTVIYNCKAIFSIGSQVMQRYTNLTSCKSRGFYGSIKANVIKSKRTDKPWGIISSI